MKAETKVLLGCIGGIFLAAIEGTVVGTVMPKVATELGGLDVYNWVFSVYMMSAAVTMPIWGKLADLYGARRLFVLGVLVFLAGSMGAGTSGTITALIAWRALQGLGAGALFSIPMTILANKTAPERRGHVLGFAAGTWGVSALLGPPVGALVVALLGWRWVFYLNIPFGIAALWLVSRHYRDPAIERRHRLDVPGALLIAAATLAILLGTQAARESGAILGLPAWAWGLLVVVLIPVIVFVERRAPEPLVPVHLMRVPLYRVANLATFLMAFCVLAAIVYMPMMATVRDPENVARAGLSLVPASLGWTTGSLVGGRIVARVGARTIGLAGAVSSSLGFLAAGFLSPDSSLWAIMPTMFPIGLGIGLSSPALLVTLQNRLGHGHMGIVTAGVSFHRHLGGTLGVTLLGAFVPTQGVAAIAAGVQHAFWAASLILVLAFLLMWRLPQSIFADPEEQPEMLAVAESTMGAQSGVPPAAAPPEGPARGGEAGPR